METTILNNHGQPVIKAFNKRRNNDKCAYSLLGILQGIIADDELNDMEVTYLDIWMKSQNNLDYNDGDVIDLIEQIKEIQHDGYMSQEDLIDLKNMIKDILEYGKQSSNKYEDSINELVSIMLGISSDKKLTNGEFYYLDNWLLANPYLVDKWPANILIDRIKEIKADGIVDKNEKIDFLSLLKKLSGQQFLETGSSIGATAEVFSEDIEDFKHKNLKICFTGKFLSGTRNHCENLAKEKGAIITKSVTKSLDVLILGAVASKDWRFSNHGKKIEKAIKYKDSGQKLLIFSEEKWLQYLNT